MERKYFKDAKTNSLLECLKWCGVPSLPDEDDKENIWIKAIALVQKADGSESYVAIKKDEQLRDKIVKDFGSVSVIRVVKTIYPYSYLSGAYVPQFKTKKKEERISYLQKIHPKEDFSQMSVKELDKQVVISAMQYQIKKEEQQKDY